MSILCGLPTFPQGDRASICPFPDTDTVWGDALISVVSLHSRLSVHLDTGDVSEEEGEPASELKEGSSKKGIVDKLSVPCTLQKIYQGLMMQADGVKELIYIVEGTDISYLPVMVPFLQLVTWAFSRLPGRSASEMKDSDKAQAP